MNQLHLSETISRLRREKKVTQEQLADFVGVTKASVSKWETGQSLPDLLLLPALAAFFNITIDELIGYKPYLSREQIQTIYHELASDFAKLPFEQVMEQSQTLVKKYYSCYPFLFQICCLWLNHFMLASLEKQPDILTAISELCSQIINNSRDIGLCNDTMIIKASADLYLGKSQEVIETLEDLLNPYRLSSQSDSLLIQAYQTAKEQEKAIAFTQISMFLHLLSLVVNATQYLSLHQDNVSICETTIQRITTVIDAYKLEDLHPSSSAQFWYQTAVLYCTHAQKEDALTALEHYVSCIDRLFTLENPVIHSDPYFDQLELWYEKSDLGSHAPRDKKIIFNSAMQAFEHPSMKDLKEDKHFQNLCTNLRKKGETL